MIALPIPDKSSTVTYDQLRWKDGSLGELVEALTAGKQKARFYAHLDPDVRADLMKRAPGWRPALGQEGAALSHLRKQGVGAGDLFLFWGLFQRVDGALKKVGSPFHAIWGWLQVGHPADVASEILPALDSECWRWAAPHPHVTIRAGQKPRKRPNGLFVAAERLALPGTSRTRLAGAGVFDRFRPELQLTAGPEKRLSLWSLPAWFTPGGRKPLTYHSRRDRWTPKGDRVLLQSVGRGQEFVLDLDQYPEAVGWLRGLLSGKSSGPMTGST